MEARGVAGGVLCGEGGSFRDEVQSGKVGWLIYRHKDLLELAQYSHDGFLLGLCCARVDEGPRCRAPWWLLIYEEQPH